MIATLLRYWRTARYLKFSQLYGRVRFKLSRPRADMRPAPTRRALGVWTPGARTRPSMVGPLEFRFLNVTRTLAEAGWNPVPKLWAYNLHYFSDLCAHDAPRRAAWHDEYLKRWLQDNPPPHGVAWDPYPTSLRMTNWVKWTLGGGTLTPECAHSLAVQARWLMKRLEWHLLGNHLFVNAKALIFAGVFFAGPEADAWLRQGVAILRKQIPEQILPDGGQFELTPMYHALALEDMLDLYNLARAPEPEGGGALAAFRALVREEVAPRIPVMRHWLAAMCHPDGEISFFNDAAIGIAPSPAELDAYAQRLGFAAQQSLTDGLTHLPDSGYIRVQRGPMVAILDVARIGPDYLPGHAHADTLSFELSLHGERLLTNSGTLEYEMGAKRQQERGTAAHNTVEVDGLDSSEVWSSFRVARRARPFDLKVKQEPHGSVAICCSHDGYRSRLGAIVTRRWTFEASKVWINDACVPKGVPCKTRWHFAPGVRVAPQPRTPPNNPADHEYRCDLPNGRSALLSVGAVTDTLAESTVHMEFGLSTPAPVLKCSWDEESICTLEWD